MMAWWVSVLVSEGYRLIDLQTCFQTMHTLLHSTGTVYLYTTVGRTHVHEDSRNPVGKNGLPRVVTSASVIQLLQNLNYPQYRYR